MLGCHREAAARRGLDGCRALRRPSRSLAVQAADSHGAAAPRIQHHAPTARGQRKEAFTSMLRSAFLSLACLLLATAYALADPPSDHESRFEFTEAFIKDIWVHPIETLDVTLKGEGPVHTAQDDCEL